MEGEAAEQLTAAHISTYKRSLWHPSIKDSAAKAEQKLQAAGIPRPYRRQRIFIPLLTYRRRGLSLSRLIRRTADLCKMVQSFQTNVVAYNNSADIFVFSVGNAAEASYMAQCGSKLSSTNIFFLAVHEFWEEPPGSARQSGLWSFRRHGVGYRLMGQWRLLFPFTLADVLGYRYVWQLDDDSEITMPINTKLVEWMQDNNYVMSGRGAYQDIPDVTWGLPELAKTFLVAERQVPLGPLLTDHVEPPGWDGLFTLRQVEQNQRFEAPPNQGWDRTVMYGNCLLMDLEFWFQPIVQRWIELVISSGYHFRFRWNEQSVLGMTWQMLVPKNRFALLPIPWNGYKHDGLHYPDKRQCRERYSYQIPCPGQLDH
eukprot:GHUV01015258.1.p1 GENE.GHUV01015258.1~~GHUV01015258.1.p1  ORF type:complete len:370 (+),score=54.36 GHUV01015258.1:1049-2158(+)